MSHYQQFEPPFEIPDSWEWVKLDELCAFLSRGKSPKYSDLPNEYPVFAQKCNLKEGGISLKHARFLDAQTVDKWDIIYRLCDNDILINSTGTGTVGRTRLFKSSYLEHYPFTVPDSHVSVVRVVNLIKAEYVFSVISSDIYQQYLQENLAGSTNQKELYIDVIGSMMIPLPPTNEQEKIITWVGNGNTLVANIENASLSVIDTIQKCKAKILELAIQGKLVPQDPTDESAAEMLRRINPKAKIITDNPHSWNIPARWSIFKLRDFAKVVTGCTPSKNESRFYGTEYPFYKPQDLDKKIVSEATEYLSKEGLKLSRKIPKDSIAVCCIGSVGKVGYINNMGATNQQINTIIPNDFFYPKFLYYYCNCSIFQNSITSLSSAITIAIVNKGKMEGIPILLPPLNEQKRIVAKIEELYSCLDKIEASLQS